MDALHAYEKIPLFHAGLVLGLVLVLGHALMLVRPVGVQRFLKRFPRNQMLGQVLMGIGFLWFWLLVAPPTKGLLGSLSMDLGEFNGSKKLLQLLVPVTLVAVVIAVRDFLAVRALGVLGLLAASPLLEAAFLKDPQSRLLVPVYAYAMLTASMFFVGMPYLFRDLVDWVTAKPARWTAAALGGLVYGVAVLVCALLFWRGF